MVRAPCPSAQVEVAALRAANARLREVIEAEDTENAVLRAELEACQAQLGGVRADGGGAAPGGRTRH